jgi:hypothetical protein
MMMGDDLGGFTDVKQHGCLGFATSFRHKPPVGDFAA